MRVEGETVGGGKGEEEKRIQVAIRTQDIIFSALLSALPGPPRGVTHLSTSPIPDQHAVT